VFGPARVIAYANKFKCEPMLKSNETTTAAFVAGPDFNGTLAANSEARPGAPGYASFARIVGAAGIGIG
jgi:hypothetical protein